MSGRDSQIVRADEHAPESTRALTLARDSLDTSEVVARTRKVAEVMKAVMKAEVHYGVIPGTQKPTLYQPGAEKLLMTFQLAPDLQIEDLSDGDSIRYRVVAEIRHVPSGEIVGVGVGEASSNEDKYRWRRAVCNEEWEATPEDRRRERYGKKRGGGHFTVKQIRTEPADIANTVLKMAKKRALVDGAKSTTAASDVFDQDLEDLAEAGIDLQERAREEAERRVAQPQAKPAPRNAGNGAPDEPPHPAEQSAGGTGGGNGAEQPQGDLWNQARNEWHDRGSISEAQLRRLYAVAANTGCRGAEPPTRSSSTSAASRRRRDDEVRVRSGGACLHGRREPRALGHAGARRQPDAPGLLAHRPVLRGAWDGGA